MNTTNQAWSDTSSNIALLLARGFASPKDFSPEDPELLRALDLSTQPQLAPARDTWLTAWQSALNSPEATLLAYSKLFLGPFQIQASPYASHYLDPAKRLMGETSMWVAEAYATAGLVPPADRHCDAPDHLCLECEFLYYLGYQLSQSRQNKAGDSEQWEARIDDFLQNHFLRWAPQCAKSILDADTSAYHRAAAAFLQQWLQSIR
ncbi:molecular chaperone TorD family protein [Coraliomargarita sp. SDUM461004]|uniref:Molecular chaperone TorD family protein n=1 Tax=Thalassobacterium sedimentorum TaxID=3041258 RepID=A0ABU1AI42_9BACT|nr:molecular chaperone TorD family protein [Coraliomargarita sp. SDUM461004]MDQ8194486.1 molecular chaperone TorD family protein [Coraliomargarita sp. SDUM461004]